MSRSHRNWPGGIHRCSKCGKEYKQGASLAAHIIAGCTPKKPRRSRYPKHYQDFLDRRAEAEAASLPKTL
jgi:predicted  nucleic acid-binding Zn-ribbon protein